MRCVRYLILLYLTVSKVSDVDLKIEKSRLTLGISIVGNSIWAKYRHYRPKWRVLPQGGELGGGEVQVLLVKY